MPRIPDPTSPYWIDNAAKVRDLQRGMAARGLDAYLATRPRSVSFLTDTFCPWRTYLIVPAQGDPVLYTFVVDATRVAEESWLPAGRAPDPVPAALQRPATAKVACGAFASRSIR